MTLRVRRELVVHVSQSSKLPIVMEGVNMQSGMRCSALSKILHHCTCKEYHTSYSNGGCTLVYWHEV